MSDEFTNIGNEMVEQSKGESSARGIVTELFPYIFVASKRMSVRAISEWLLEVKKIKVSHVSISTALKKSEQFLVNILEAVLPSAKHIAELCNTNAAQVLFDEDYDEMARIKHYYYNPSIADARPVIPVSTETMTAIRKLENSWFNYPAEVRSECEKMRDLYWEYLED